MEEDDVPDVTATSKGSQLEFRACVVQMCNHSNLAGRNLQEYIRVYSEKHEVWSMEELKERLRVNSVVSYCCS